MKIGFVGLGKLGLPVALVINKKGHEVFGYDTSENPKKYLDNQVYPNKEKDIDPYIRGNTVKMTTIEEIVAESDLIFLAIQTPHEEQYEGVTRIPTTRADFNYDYLKASIDRLAQEATKQLKTIDVVIISTVLPGTIKREIVPLLQDRINIVYNPFFIAMGTVIPDFLNPEFVLLGVENLATAEKLKKFYATIHSKPFAEMDIIDAELTKVSYNTFIGMKIAFVNTLMEICEKNGGNVDSVTNALKMATDRLISTKYLNAGMGDGGGCHPRDNIAMSYLAKSLNLSHNIFEDIMQAREDQTEWLACQLANLSKEKSLPIVILGKAFKPETSLTVGSPATLLRNLLSEYDLYSILTHVDPHIDSVEDFIKALSQKAIFFIGTQHSLFLDIGFLKGSVVVDPFRYIPEQEGVELISLGKPKK